MTIAQVANHRGVKHSRSRRLRADLADAGALNASANANPSAQRRQVGIGTHTGAKDDDDHGCFQ